MRKTYPLHVEGRHPDRVLDAIKHDVRKYLKRERRRDLPEGVDYWDFDCKVGDSKDSAAVVHLSALISSIDAVAQAKAALRAAHEAGDTDALIEAQIPAQQFRDMGLREGETLVVTPRRARVFVESAR